MLYVVTLASRTGRYGGPYDITSEQARILQRAGHQASLVAGTLAEDDPAVSSETEGHLYVEVRAIFAKLPLVSLMSGRMLFELWRQVGRHGAVHVSMARELIPVVAALFAILQRRPLFLQPHGMLTSRTSAVHRAADVVMLPVMRAAHSVFALTPTEAEQLFEKYGVTAINIGNPVAGIAPAAKIVKSGRSAAADVLFLARLHQRKRVEDFARAALVAASHSWSERYCVVGPDEGGLAQLRRFMHCAEDLSYEGALSQQDAVARVARCQIFVLTSRDEPWGNALAIALACRKPVVVPASAALAPAVRRHGAGLVYDDGDVFSLASHVHRLAAEPAFYEACARGAAGLAEDMLSPNGYKDRLLGGYRGFV